MTVTGSRSRMIPPALLLASLATLPLAPAEEARPGLADSIASAVTDPARPEADKARDSDRKPAAVLESCGVKPGIRSPT